MPSDEHDPAVEEAEDPTDRDERRVQAMEHLFREASEGEPALSPDALEKIADALRGEAPER